MPLSGVVQSDDARHDGREGGRDARFGVGGVEVPSIPASLVDQEVQAEGALGLPRRGGDIQNRAAWVGGNDGQADRLGIGDGAIIIGLRGAEAVRELLGRQELAIARVTGVGQPAQQIGEFVLAAQRQGQSQRERPGRVQGGDSLCLGHGGRNVASQGAERRGGSRHGVGGSAVLHSRQGQAEQG